MLPSSIISVLFAGSLALPWTSEWTGQHYRGWSVLFAGDEYSRLGVLLVAAWAVAVVIGMARPNHAVAAIVAAATVCVICPGIYGWEVTRNRGSAIGQDAAGNVAEWDITATPDIGFYVAALAAISLLVAVVLRVGARRSKWASTSTMA